MPARALYSALLWLAQPLYLLRLWWRGRADEQAFLRRLRESACKRFGTVLSPDYNAAHYNHLHFDMGRTMKNGSTFCR